MTKVIGALTEDAWRQSSPVVGLRQVMFILSTSTNRDRMSSSTPRDLGWATRFWAAFGVWSSLWSGATSGERRVREESFRVGEGLGEERVLGHEL